MKSIFFNSSFLLLALSLLCGSCSTPQADNHETMTKEQATKWLNEGEWRNGVTLQPHSSVDAQEFAAQYRAHKDRWDKAFTFLKEQDLGALTPGNYPIDGENVYASVSEYVPKPFDSTQWESHRRYADIQYMITGEEKIGKTPVSSVAVTVPYDSSKDVAHYKGEGEYYQAQPGTFFIFFPGEAHRPNINTGQTTDSVKKIVIKVQVTP